LKEHFLPDEALELDFLPDEALELDFLPDEALELDFLPDETLELDFLPDDAFELDFLPDEGLELDFLPDEGLELDFLPDEGLEPPISFIIFFPKGLVFNTHLPVAGFLIWLDLHGFGSFGLRLRRLGLDAFLPDEGLLLLDNLELLFLPDDALEPPISFIIFFPKGLVFNTHLPVAGFLT
jgi:hypothetical protein